MSAPVPDVFPPRSQPAVATPPPRLQAAPLLKRLFWALLLPVGLALLIDWQLGSLPWVLLATALICIPLASFVVSRAALRDFERVLAAVAPPATEEPASAEQAAPSEPEVEAATLPVAVASAIPDVQDPAAPSSDSAYVSEHPIQSTADSQNT